MVQVISRISEIRQKISEFKNDGVKIGLVPTMGALHIGHESLVKKAKEECDAVIVSVFVNPIQFGPSEDFDKYPRQLEQDRKTCLKYGVDYIFAPDEKEMYPGKDITGVVPPESYQNKLCGKSRPGHFNGVATVVLKLFNIITPDKAYFGRKDAQQLVIIRKMTEDLNLPVEIVGCPIIRDADGLACSSRNKYLSENAREKALCINRALKKIEELYNSGINSVFQAKDQAVNLIHPDAEIEYFEALNLETLSPVEKLEDNVLVAVAVKIEGVRLIDNIII